jgi:hypothetical protein
VTVLGALSRAALKMGWPNIRRAACAGCGTVHAVATMEQLPTIVLGADGVGVRSYRCGKCQDLWMLHSALCRETGALCVWREGIFRNGAADV